MSVKINQELLLSEQSYSSITHYESKSATQPKPHPPMKETESHMWITNIIVPKEQRIISLSDIHGDIHSLIVALRDCAKVIKKKFPINNKELDYSAEILLEYDLNLDLEKDIKFYKDDLDYEWCGNNTLIVFCGDFLDGFRNSYGNYRIPCIESRCDKCMDLEYDQVEIKIFKFINAINKEAMGQGGRIFKILGNHEFINLNDESINNYIPIWTKSLKNYYKGMTREEYFRLNNEGGALIFEDGAGLLLKINNNIFVHGRLDHSKTFDDYEKINNILNSRLNPKSKHEREKLIRQLNTSCNLTTWGRKYNRNFNSYESENEIDLSTNQPEKCKQIKDFLERFISLIPSNKYNVKEMRVIVGHCPQYLNSNSYYNASVNSSFTKITKNDNIEILTAPVRTSRADAKNDFIFGIGMECNKEDLDNPKQFPNYTDGDLRVYVDYDERYIYKVDIGSSRAFDLPVNTVGDDKGLSDFGKYIFSREFEKENLGSRVSQILEIKNNNINIIRSTIKNTRIHQPRQMYEEHINKYSIKELDLLNPNYRKYIKK